MSARPGAPGWTAKASLRAGGGTPGHGRPVDRRPRAAIALTLTSRRPLAARDEPRATARIVSTGPAVGPSRHRSPEWGSSAPHPAQVLHRVALVRVLIVAVRTAVLRKSWLIAPGIRAPAGSVQNGLGHPFEQAHGCRAARHVACTGSSWSRYAGTASAQPPASSMTSRLARSWSDSFRSRVPPGRNRQS